MPDPEDPKVVDFTAYRADKGDERANEELAANRIRHETALHIAKAAKEYGTHYGRQVGNLELHLRHDFWAVVREFGEMPQLFATDGEKVYKLRGNPRAIDWALQQAEINGLPAAGMAEAHPGELLVVDDELVQLLENPFPRNGGSDNDPDSVA